MDTAQSALTVALRLVLSGLRSVTPFLAQSLFSSWVSLVPFLRGPFSEPRQLVAWAQAGPPVVNSSPWGFSICKTAHRMWLRILSVALKVLDDA